MIRVAIVDDHPMTRRGVEGILAGADGLVVTQTSATPGALDPHTLDVVVHDLYLAEETPSLVSITELSALTRVLVMSAYSKPVDVLACVRAGARGYVTKDASPEMLIRTVEAVAAGGFAMSPQLADILQAAIAQEATGQRAESPGGELPPILAPLGPRESETLDLIAQGFTHHQIARKMGVTKATVDTYVERIRKKLQVGNKAELTRAALVRRGQGQDGTG